MPNTESSRQNGSKSKGPTTPEGKARSSRNAIKHGLNSAQVVLEHEDRAAFEAMRQSYMERHHPADQHEADLVETMVSAQWRLNRIVTTEAQIFEKEIGVRTPELKKRFPAIDPEGTLACAFEHLAEGRALALLLRYESQLNRTYERAFKQLQALQSTPPPPERNEPKLLEFPLRNEPTEAPDPPQNDPPPTSEPPEPPDSAPKTEGSAR